MSGGRFTGAKRMSNDGGESANWQAAMDSEPTAGTVIEEPDRMDGFPPVSTSLEAFLVNGSDRTFRELIYKVLSTSTHMLRARDRFAAHMGVSGPQYSMMVAIGEAGTATVGQIAARLHVSSPFVTAEIGKLIKRDIVERRPNDADRRSNILMLTETGKQLIRDVGPLRRMTNDMIFGSLNASQARALNRIMSLLLADSERALRDINPPVRQKARDRTHQH
jgi:MarR family transcriptional regulator, organic hydroperoxide resistance regulator